MITGAVIDTSVVSKCLPFITTKPQFIPYLTLLGNLKSPVISFQTLAELEFGAENKGWGLRKKGELAEFLSSFEVVYPNPDMVSLWGKVMTQSRRQGRELSTADCWVATTAIYLGLPLIYHDADFFVEIPGLKIRTFLKKN